MRLRDNLYSETTWDIYETRYDPDQMITSGSNFMIGNGFLGYRGTFPDDRAEQYVGCIVTDTWDNADGVWSELVNAPNGLWLQVLAGEDGGPLCWREASPDTWRRTLDFRYGVWRGEAAWPEAGIHMVEERFAGRDELHLLAARTRITASSPVRLEVRTGIDGQSWNLNGEHLPELVLRHHEGSGTVEAAGRTGQHHYDVVVVQGERFSVEGRTPGEGRAPTPAAVVASGRRIESSRVISLQPGETVTVERYVGVFTTNDLRESGDTSVEAVRHAAAAVVQRARNSTWDALIQAHRAAWDGLWQDLDVQIDGDELAQTVLRYNLYHNVIATPIHADHLPVGARGLSCQAYQGAAFWDQEVYNMPHFLYTRPEIARNILTYRYRTLPGARQKARDLGYQGAFYAWVSGDTGHEICPSWFFKDVLSGRPIRNHFNDWQIHISPDIVWALDRYIEVTQDRAFLISCGAEIAFEVARFLVSRVHYRVDRECYEVIRVLGPDEYHENVDNNYFTNWQVRYACAAAARWYRELHSSNPAELAEIARRINLHEKEPGQWEDVAERIFVPTPDPQTGLIEQFQGFFQLEDISPEDLKERLLDPGEYWGWPNGIAVATQVSKQADVLQLMVMHPQAEELEVIRRNWEYYEPRTQHGSSLSYAVYATSAARLELLEDAYRYFLRSCTVDLFNTGKAISGGTFIGGIHTAACGVAWQIAVQGFGGVAVTTDGISLDPHLPPGWDRLTFTLRWRGAAVDVTITPADITASSRRESTTELPLRVGSAGWRQLLPGEMVVIARG